MEDVVKWHHGVPSPEQYEQAQKELDERGGANLTDYNWTK